MNKLLNNTYVYIFLKLRNLFIQSYIFYLRLRVFLNKIWLRIKIFFRVQRKKIRKDLESIKNSNAELKNFLK